MADDDLHLKLNYLENRVTFARLFYPAKARNRIAMEMADAHSTSTCIGLSASKGSNGNLGKADLNEIPFMHKEKLQERLQALLKTVERSGRFFPYCSV
ncbi:BTB/POZ domain and ankyrin repeat-containing protein NPR2-like [Ziziphus jujuba]|uniref:BTB/POZ domain and ankyrin repeat-containing protein NPR2-like n=1 Tax=Ziziphus jujuba TaxID=326968 RepID=A0ABM4A6D8_ZIZJJ|nr:BTB/POZ domain and ankyrin repeat-containing protein NPR2-like [Ziziphus jujuba]XP_060672290.1 BTB/POZ domain and ankyrin repeat-containing protein NPR2-like [Ziziphus jujuba]